jgi:hypothetical protein
MFKRHVITLTFLWLLVAFACFWILHAFSPDAQLAYQRLMNFSDQVKKEQSKEQASPTQQIRHQVSKQIFYNKEGQRLQSRLVGDYSELTLNLKGEEPQLVERFRGLACALQEKLIDAPKHEGQGDTSSQEPSQPQQYLRCFKAQEADYSYKTGRLEAEEVEVAHYLIPGFHWPESFDAFQPLLQGRAEKLQLSMFKERTFKAEGFQATFHDWGSEW